MRGCIGINGGSRVLGSGVDRCSFERTVGCAVRALRERVAHTPPSENDKRGAFLQSRVGTKEAEETAMRPNATPPVMQWEMYGASSIIEFRGLQDNDGYGFCVTRDEVTVLVAEAKGIEGLLRRSSQLREHLQQVGYSCRPLASRASQFGGGVCWGPAAPLDSAMLQSLQ
jgi:hypothetical protein